MTLASLLNAATTVGTFAAPSKVCPGAFLGGGAPSFAFLLAPTGREAEGQGQYDGKCPVLHILSQL